MPCFSSFPAVPCSLLGPRSARCKLQVLVFFSLFLSCSVFLLYISCSFFAVLSSLGATNWYRGCVAPVFARCVACIRLYYLNETMLFKASGMANTKLGKAQHEVLTWHAWVKSKSLVPLPSLLMSLHSSFLCVWLPLELSIAMLANKVALVTGGSSGVSRCTGDAGQRTGMNPSCISFLVWN